MERIAMRQSLPVRPASGWVPWTPTKPSPMAAGSGGHEPSQRVLLVAEIANAHEGRAASAVRLIRASAEAGCDAIKFQKYYADEMLSPGHPMMSTFARWEWDAGVWSELIETCRAANLTVLMDVFGVRAYQSLAAMPPIDGLKIHAADVSNVPLLDLLAETSCPILIGTGGVSDLDIYQAISRLGRPERLVLMHGYQAFPCPLEDTALRRIQHLSETFEVAVGLSDHLDADDPFAKVLPLMAVPLGVCCVEKHITLDRASHGVDYQSSLDPDEMAELARWVRQSELALGQAHPPRSDSEAGYRRRFKKSLITKAPVAKGETIRFDHITQCIVDNPPRFSLYQAEALGKTARRNVPMGTILSGQDLNLKTGLCLIARLKSQRLPRKALADVCGKPALLHLFERARLCDAVAQTVLCTSTHPEDAPLIHLAREHGLATYAGSPDQPLERLIACAEMYGWQYVIRATGDNIFLDPELLAQAVNLATEQNLDYVSMRTVPVGTHCEVFSTVCLRVIQQHSQAPFTTEYLTWFVLDNPNFRAADLPVSKELQRNYRLTLDTPEDLLNIREVMARLATAPQPYTLADVIRAVESDPELARRCTFQPAVEMPPAEVRFNFKVGAA